MKTKFIYIAGGISSSVTRSQVVNWLRVLSKNSIKFDLIFTIRIIDIINSSYRKNTFHLLNEIKKKHKVYLIPALRTKSNGFLFKTILWLLLVKIRGFKNRKLIIQTRESKHYKVVAGLKKNFKGIKFIFEHRGVRAEEHINSLGYITHQSIDDKKVKKQYNLMIDDFRSNCDIADKIVNVSRKMNDYVAKKTGPENKIKTIVIPGAADVDSFYFSNKLRLKQRKILGLKNEFIILYTGRLDPTWHMKDFLFEFFGSVTSQIENTFVICLTPDIITAEDLRNKYQINKNKIFIKQEANNKINNYLNAADVAVIFRKKIPTNYYASPTKLAEYLVSGIPIIVSEGIGDYSEFISTHNCGMEVKNNIDSIMKSIKQFPVYNRERNAKFSQKYFSKQSQIKKYLTLYSEIM